MRNFLMGCFILLGMSCYGQIYETSKAKSSYNRIGYTTTTPNITTPYNNYNNVVTPTYKISISNNNYSSAQAVPFSNQVPRVRRITVYDNEGNPRETPGGDNDNPDWLYIYNEQTGKWYCSPDGTTWYEYRRANGLGEWFLGLIGQLFGTGGWGPDWRPYRGNESTPPGDPMDPYMEPIGNELILLIFLFLFLNGRLVCRFYKKT